jgi:ABC-2 type transport system permease protein
MRFSGCWSKTMLRAELTKQLFRVRSLVALGALAAVPVVAAAITASKAGEQNGHQGGLFGASPYSALNHAAASLQFAAPLLLAVVVALLGSALGAADRDWGTLRYLYVRPVSPLRLLIGKASALLACSLLATWVIVVVGVLIGSVIFGWHPFHRIDASTLSSATAAARMIEAALYVTLCALSIATIAFALGVLMPGPAEALAASIVLIVVSHILDGQPSLHTIADALPVHYWDRWTPLLTGGPAGLGTGIAVQLAWVLGALAVASLVLARRDPAA